MRLPFWRGGTDMPVPAASTSSARRGPRVALALGAGAARGWAQIGVLQELSSYGLLPEIVVGTSIGAVVGGCFCAGRLTELEGFARSLTKRRVFGLMDFTISGLGLLAGSRLKTALRRDLGPVRIEELPIRFAAVATQIQTGHEIWLTHGDLVDALRASYALPGIFEPVEVDGRWLIDGALVNPVPVSVCRALGADIVVAINLVAETLARPEATPALVAAAAEADQIGEARLPLAARSVFEAGTTAARMQGGAGPVRPTIAQVLVDAFNITQDRISRSRLAGDPPDLTINAKVGGVGLFEFHRAAELIAIGRDAAQKALPELSQLLM